MVLLAEDDGKPDVAQADAGNCEWHIQVGTAKRSQFAGVLS
jgi:hypothetical protein